MPSTKLSLKVIPGASSDAIAGWMGDALRVRVVVAPEKGKANQAVVNLLASKLGLARSAITISQGASSQYKTATIQGLSVDQVQSRLSATMD